MPICANPCQSVPILANPVPIEGQSMQIRANPCQSRANSFISPNCQYVPIRRQCFSPTHILRSSANSRSVFQQLSKANSRQSRSIHYPFSNPTPFRHPCQSYAEPPIQSHSANAVPICVSSLPPIQRPSSNPVLHLSEKVSQLQPRTYINATKLKVDWHSIGKGIHNSGQSGANFRPFT